MSERRSEKQRQVNKRILILCEGSKTEPNYLTGIKYDKSHSNRLAALRIVIHDTETNTAKELLAEAIELIKEAKRELNPYDAVWIVVDKDGYTKHPEAFNRARDKSIKIAFSSPCFEYWLLLHFEYTTAPFPNYHEVAARLKHHLSDFEKAGDHYEVLRPNIPTAVVNGQKIMDHQHKVGNGKIWTYNPYTDVGLLIDSLIKL